MPTTRMDCGLEIRGKTDSQRFWKTVWTTVLGFIAVAAVVVIQHGETERRASNPLLKTPKVEARFSPTKAS